MSGWFEHYREVWLADFEFGGPDGGRPEVRCLVARELRTCKTLRYWADELERMPEPPFDCGPEALFVAYFASAELGCFAMLDWRPPVRILDLYIEFRLATNGLPTAAGRGLLGALVHYGLGAIEAAEKSEMRELARRGGDYTAAEREALLNYCESDVVALAKLLPRMAPRIDLPRALLRGRYMAAVARMEAVGVPIDVVNLRRLQNAWEAMKGHLVESLDSYGVFESGANGGPRTSFSTARFATFLTEQGVPWPRLASGRLALDERTFREMARTHSQVATIREVRVALGEMRLFENLAVGPDGRNRCLLSPFSSKTGRNQPSNARFIFGPSVWLRSLIKPEEGRAVAYVDWSQQEFGIAGALSGDAAMQDAYASGDPYMTFAIQAGAAPSDATRESHAEAREQFKACVLAVQYGMGEQSLGQRIGRPSVYARELLRLHRETYPTYWRWSESAVMHAMLVGWLETVFGWRVYAGSEANSRSMANFPMQATGAEMLRLACCLAIEKGIDVCAPVHDALLVEGPIDEIDHIVDQTRDVMAEASRIVLDGMELRTDASVVRWPERYSDPRGERMWREAIRFLDEASSDPD